MTERPNIEAALAHITAPVFVHALRPGPRFISDSCPITLRTDGGRA